MTLMSIARLGDYNRDLRQHDAFGRDRARARGLAGDACVERDGGAMTEQLVAYDPNWPIIFEQAARGRLGM